MERTVTCTALVAFLVFLGWLGAVQGDMPAEPDAGATQARPGTGSMLKKLKPEEIVSMQIFRLERDGREVKKRYTGRALNETSVKGILALCRSATKHRFGGLELIEPDHIMVVKLTNGEIFEIAYDSHFLKPFDDLDSPPLKEALFALATETAMCSIIRFQEGEVLDVTRWNAGSSFAFGGSWSKYVQTSMWLTEDGRMMLKLRMKKGDRVVVDDTQPIRYGEAKTFGTSLPGHVIVLLQMPDTTSWH